MGDFNKKGSTSLDFTGLKIPRDYCIEMEEKYMKNKKMLAMLLALTVTAAGTPVYAADFSDGNLESVQEAAEPEEILTGDTALEEDSNAQENQESDESGFTSAEETDEFTEEDVASAFTDDTENEGAEAQSSDTESGGEEETGTEGLEYEYDAETDTYHLVKGVNVESVIIPEQYNGKIVSEIGEKAFAGCDRIKNVRVNRDWEQETMIIRQSAFEGCIHLRKVVLNRVLKVEKNAFRNCPQLSECVYISINNLFIDGGEFIERDAFDPDNKVCVYLGDESNNFKGNDQYFLAGLWDEDYVFEENGVTYVCYAPNMTGDMEGISREHEGTRILDVQDELETVFVKDTNVTGVGRKAFYGNEKIKVVKLGSQNRYIETKAFFDCENLERVYIPDTTNDIADDAFEGCNSLVIYTPKGSYAEKFARKHNIPVVVSATLQDILNDVKPNLRVTKKEKDGVTLKWEISQPYLAEGYEVERKNAQGEYVHCSTIKSSEVNTKDIELWNYSKFYGKNITFRVKAYFVDEDGTIIYSQPSNTVKTTFCPVQPKITSLTKKAGKKLTVKWKKSDYAIGYQVWRSVDGKKGVCIKTIKGGDVTSFTDTNLKEGVTYIYWIKSYRMDYQNKKIYSRSNDYFRSIVY